jgi:hypothetical protein
MPDGAMDNLPALAEESGASEEMSTARILPDEAFKILAPQARYSLRGF